MKARLVLAAIALLFAGCATKRLPPDFAEFSTAYAGNMNWQMLLNLARLDQGHPAYFMAIGEIRLGRTQSTTGQLSGTNSETRVQTVAAAVSNTVTKVMSGTSSVNASSSASPSFVFIPINSEEAAKQLLAPISIEVFNTLYQQGWPVDQLMRVLVERIEVDLPGEDGEVRHVVLNNSPTRGTPDSFARFLRVCEIVRELQRSGGLNLVADERFTPVSAAEVPTVAAKEIMDAADKNRSWQKNPHTNAWQLGTMRSSYRFQANQPIVDATVARFNSSSETDDQASLANLKSVFAATVSTTPGESLGRNQNGPRSTLILRSFRNVLEAVASEQQAFDALAADSAFSRRVPSRQLRPVLRFNWDQPKDQLAAPAVSLTYAGQRYAITDALGSPANLDSRWNRDIFRLLVNLSSQVTVDITKFQRQVLEVN